MRNAMHNIAIPDVHINRTLLSSHLFHTWSTLSTLTGPQQRLPTEIMRRRLCSCLGGCSHALYSAACEQVWGMCGACVGKCL